MPPDQCKKLELENDVESVSQLAKKAIEVERIRLVEAILHSLDKPDHNIEQSWAAKCEARSQAHKRGELDAYWEEMRGKGMNIGKFDFYLQLY